MARPRKSGIDYFPFDTDFFSDNKIRILRARFGADGMMLFIFILCEIYREGYYLSWNEDTEFIVADELGMSHEKVKQVMTFLYGRSLLTKRTLATPDTIITSAGIQSRYQLAVKERGTKNQIDVDGLIWLLDATETKPWIKVTHLSNCSENNRSISENNGSNSVEKVHKGKERKVKERKVEEEAAAAESNAIFHYMELINPAASSREINQIDSWLRNGISDELINVAIDEAVDNNARSMNYLRAIVNSCLSEGIKTPEQFMARKRMRKAYKNKKDVRGNYSDQGDLSAYAQIKADDPTTLFGGEDEAERSEKYPW